MLDQNIISKNGQNDQLGNDSQDGVAGAMPIEEEFDGMVSISLPYPHWLVVYQALREAGRGAVAITVVRQIELELELALVRDFVTANTFVARQYANDVQMLKATLRGQ